MRKIIVMLTVSMLLVCIPGLAGAETAVIDRIVATVNGEIITLSELEKFKALMYMGASEKSSEADVDRKMLQQMLEKKVIAQEAKKLEIEAREKDIDQAVEEICKRNKITMKEMKEQLTKQGITLEDYRQLLRTEILQSQVIGREIQASITITEEDIQEYYDQNIRPKEKPGERVRIQQILLVIPPESPPGKIAEIESAVTEIQKKIIAGESFEKMAVTYSQGPAAKIGGDLGYFHKGELLPAIENTAFSMEKGQVSPVIKTSIGFHIIKLIDKDTNEEDRSWKDHEDEIKAILYNKQFEKNYKEWMEGLMKKSYIEVNL